MRRAKTIPALLDFGTPVLAVNPEGNQNNNDNLGNRKGNES